MTEGMSKAELLDKFRAGQALLEALLAEVGDERRTQAGVIGAWLGR
jgi:hypothetical protein